MRARGRIDLGDAESLPYRVDVDARGLDAGTLLTQAGLGGGLVEGSVDMKGQFSARHVPGRHPLEALSGQLEVEARDGSVRHDLPVVVALTLASDIFSLNPDRDRVRYDRCRATLAAEEGVVRTEALELDGPDVRLFASGSLDIGHAPHPLEAEMAVFLFRQVDRAIGRIPIVRDLLLGESENLLAAYYQIEGPWDAPTARSQPLRSFYTGPVRLMERLPGVVRQGVQALGEAVTPLAPGSAAASPGLGDPPPSTPSPPPSGAAASPPAAGHGPGS